MGDRERALRLMIFVLERLVIALSVVVLTDELAMMMEAHRKTIEPQTQAVTWIPWDVSP